MDDNLPVRLTRFVGRERDLEAIGRLLRTERLVTLVGTGGCGKTRLAVELAARQRPDHPDGIWLVDLSTITGPDLMAASIAATLGLAPRVVPDAARLARHLDNRRVLLAEGHVANLLNKLGAGTRAEVAAWAAQNLEVPV
jgi:predicted ATPase